jgi:pyridoxal phosphate enzyme (YggS family)
MNPIAANIAAIRARIDEACQRSGRDPQQVKLIAVSKIKPAELVEEAFAAGQQLFGENYVQEFCAKDDQIEVPLSWHFIGALQSNKVKYLCGRVAMIHSVDRLSLAKEIDRQWAKLDEKIDILLQINIGSEENKAGCSASDAVQLAKEISKLEHVQICGLMSLPPHCDDPEQVRPYFQRMRLLSEEIAALNLPGVRMDELSMGMSGDFEIAVEEGATLVRVGTAIFGERKKFLS